MATGLAINDFKGKAPQPVFGGNQVSAFDTAIPGFSSLTSGAAQNIKELLSGTPSPDESRLANSYFGINSGLNSNSPFLVSRGYDLYKTQANQRKQKGFEDYLAFLGGTSGTLVPTAGQAMQGQQFNQDLGFRQGQAGFQNSIADRQQSLQEAEFEQRYGNPQGGAMAWNRFINPAGYQGMVMNGPRYGGTWTPELTQFFNS